MAAAAAAASSGVTTKKRKTENPLATYGQPDTKSALVVPVRLADGDTITIKPPVNYTPHPLRFFAADGKTLLGTIAPLNSTGIRAQSQPATVLGDLQLVPSKEISVPLKTAQVVSGLAELPKGYDPTQTVVVSVLAAQELAKSGHTGLILCVGSSPQDAVRDEKGQIQGTRCLEVYQASSDKYITVEEELKRALAAAKMPDAFPEKVDDSKKAGGFWGLLTDIETRSCVVGQSPPSAACSTCVNFEKGKFGVNEFCHDKWLMPDWAEWEPSCARWTLDKGERGGGGEAMILREADEAVPPKEAMDTLVEFWRKKQSEFKTIFLVSDNPVFDLGTLDLFRSRYRPGDMPSGFLVGSRMHVAGHDWIKFVVRARKHFDRPPYDYNDSDAARDALKKLGFGHDHHPFNDVLMMAGWIYISIWFDAVKTKEIDPRAKEKDPNTTKVLREYDLDALRADGIKAVSITDVAKLRFRPPKTAH